MPILHTILIAEKASDIPLKLSWEETEINHLCCRCSLFLHRSTSVTAFDGVWHHICLTWENRLGSSKFYKDCELQDEGTLKTGHTIRQGGTLVLGQDQRLVGGDFDTSQSFRGLLSNVNVWDHVLSAAQITEMSTSCQLDEWNVANVYKWADFLRQGGTKLVKPSPCQPHKIMGK